MAFRAFLGVLLTVSVSASIVDELERLDVLLEKKSLSEADYELAKQVLLHQGAVPPAEDAASDLSALLEEAGFPELQHAFEARQIDSEALLLLDHNTLAHNFPRN